MELYVTGNASSSSSSPSTSGSSSGSSSSGINASISHSNSLRDLDELLMGGNDLDALPFEFDCDFGGAFEDKYLVPPLSSRAAMMSHESGFDILPPLSASLLSPSTNFQLSSPTPSLFLHCEQDRIKSTASAANRGTSNGHHMLKRKCDTAFPIEAPPSSSCSSSKMVKDQASLSPSISAVDEDATDDINSSSSSSAKSTHIGRWTKKEHELFLEGLKLYGKSWKKISSLVITRTLVQIRTHAQKYLQKQSKSAQKAAAAAAAAAVTSGAAGVSSAKGERQSSQRFGQHLGDHIDAWGKGNGLMPISFPDLLPAPSSSSSSRSTSPYILPAIVKKEPSSNGNAMCKLDQLLQDEPHYLSSTSLSMDTGYTYQSPMGTDEEILQHPMYAQWSRADPHDTTAPSASSSTAASYLPTKRRRLDHLMPARSSQLVNPMEAMTSSGSEAQHMSIFGLGPLHMGNNVFGTMDFNHHNHHQQHQQLHSYAPATAQFIDSSEYNSSANSYGSWQLS